MRRGLILLIVAAMGAAGATAQPVARDEIVVTAQVARAAITLGRNGDGKTVCELAQSSGDVAIDSALCKRASRCLKRGKTDDDQMKACIDRQKQAFVAAWTKGDRS